MIAKEYKLQIQSVLRKSGKSQKTPFFTLKTFPSSNKLPRFGVVISSKTLPSSVDRNQLKRTFFDFIQLIINQLPIADYLVIFYPAISKLSKEEIIQEFQKVFSFSLNPKP